MTPRGGPRPGAGRKRSTGPTGITPPFRLPRALVDRMRSLLDPGESLASFARAAIEGYCEEREALREEGCP